MAASESTSPVQSVDRALRILNYLAAVGEAGVTQIALDLDVHKSTAFRLVTTLEAHDLVEQAEDRGKYRLGMGLLRLAGATTARLDLVQEARSTTRELAALTGETVNIAVLSGRSALYVDQAVGASTLQPHQWVGQHVPLHATSNGKILMSELSPELLAPLLGDLDRYTERTVTDPDQLRRELAQVRGSGHARAIDELEVGLAALAVPVRNAAGELIASLSVSGPTFRLLPRLDELLPQACAAGAQVSRRMGYTVPQ